MSQDDRLDKHFTCAYLNDHAPTSRQAVKSIRRHTGRGPVALVDRLSYQETGLGDQVDFRFVGSGWSSVPREVIAVAARWYPRYGLSYRHVEELLAERGVKVDQVTIYRWVQTFTPEFIDAPVRRSTPTAPAIAEAILAAKHAKVRVQIILEDDYLCEDPPLPTHGPPAARTRATGLSTPRPCAPTSTSSPT
jgi:hypothetical protein